MKLGGYLMPPIKLGFFRNLLVNIPIKLNPFLIFFKDFQDHWQCKIWYREHSIDKCLFKLVQVFDTYKEIMIFRMEFRSITKLKRSVLLINN